MKTKYRIVMKVGNDYVMTDDQKGKEVDKWIDIYKRTPQAEEISIFERDNMTYKLIHKQNKRRIGF
jgi:hypothetical protein